MRWQKVDERWAKTAASTGQLPDGATFTETSIDVPGEEKLVIRFCKRAGHPEEKLGSPKETPKTSITLHHTSGYGGFASLMGDRGGSVHFMVGRDGNVYQFIRTEWVAWHATWWNNNSIGIEIDNIGQLFDVGAGDLRSEYKSEKDGKRYDIYCDKSETGVYLQKDWPSNKPHYWATWTESQYRTLGRLLKALCKKHAIPRLIPPEPDRYKAFKNPGDRLKFKGICNHHQIDPDNRDDLGPYVDWDKIIRYAALQVGDCFSPAAHATAMGEPGAPPALPPLEPMAQPKADDKPKADAKNGGAAAKNVAHLKIGKRAGRLAISVRQPGEPIPTSPPWSGDQSAPQADGKRDDFLRAAMGFIGRPYKARSHKPDEGLDGAGLVVLGLKRVGLFAGDDVWPDGPSLATQYHTLGGDKDKAPDGIIPGDLVWFGAGDHDNDSTQHPMIFLGGGRVLGPVPDNGTNSGIVKVRHISEVAEPFGGYAHIDDLGTLTTHTEHPGDPPPGTAISGALLPAEPAEAYDFLKDLVAATGGKWLADKGKVNLIGVQELHDRCQISPRRDDWNDTLFAAYLDEAGVKCVLPMRASLNPGTDTECAGSWHLVDGSFTFKLDKGDALEKALVPDGKVKGWFDEKGAGALRPGDDPHDETKKEETKKDDDEPRPDKETFEGAVVGPGDTPMKKWPFRLKKDGTAVGKDGLGGGTTKNEFKKDLWFSDDKGEFEFKDLPQASWTIEVVLAGGRVQDFDEKPAPKGSDESGKRGQAPPPLQDGKETFFDPGES